MTCINHPETQAVAYCRLCGRPLCAACKRDVAGVVYCEPCLAARVEGASPAHAAVPGAVPPAVAFEKPPSPGVAVFLSIIFPFGVGAVYNGQYQKGLAHVLIFAALVSMADHIGPFGGLLIAAYYFYQIFDAYETAKARLHGLPPPDPFGLNNVFDRLRQHPPAAPAASPDVQPASGSAPYQSAAVPAPPTVAPAGTTVLAVAPAVEASDPAPEPSYVAPVAPVEPATNEPPVGALVLIALGLLFLLGNLGWLSFWWIGRFWPVILIVLGAWLLYRRTLCTRGGRP